VSHNSYAQLLAARRLGIPSLTAMDYEWQPANHVAFRAASRVLLPEAFPVALARRYGATDRKRATYPGLKEAVALVAARDDIGRDAAALSPWAGLDRPLAVFRPAAEYAAYHRPAEGLADGVLARLRALGCHVLVLPRGGTQAAAAARARWAGPQVEVLDGVVPGSALLARADVVVGAGGTMTREAALLGTPAYSIFRGRVPAVDLLLEREGRLVRVDNPDSVGRIELAARREPAWDDMEVTRAAVVGAVLDFVEQPATSRSPS
jgi:hypothetical protein